MKKALVSLIFILLFTICGYAQDSVGKGNLTPVKKEISNPSPSSIAKDNYGFLTSFEFVLSISILIFGVLIILFELHLIKSNHIGQEQAVKFIVVTLIIISTLFLITAGYNNDQIAPATGLLGTIAGYLLGKTNLVSAKKDE